MVRASRIVTSFVAAFAVGCGIWSAIPRFEDPSRRLTAAEEGRLANLITEHRFVVATLLNEFGIPYHTSKISPEAHALFNQKPLATLHFLHRQVSYGDAETSVRAAAIAMAAGKEFYDPWIFLDFVKRDYDSIDPHIGRSRRQTLLKMVDRRIEEIAQSKAQSSEKLPRLDRATLGRDRWPREVNQDDETVVVTLVRTPAGTGYWSHR